MTKVFIAGSRRLSRLNADVKRRIDTMIDKDFTILVGDANGADKAIQRYLAGKGYRNVIVHCMANNCRNRMVDDAAPPMLPRQDGPFSVVVTSESGGSVRPLTMWPPVTRVPSPERM
jgi:hypothetical protein